VKRLLLVATVTLAGLVSSQTMASASVPHVVCWSTRHSWTIKIRPYNCKIHIRHTRNFWVLHKLHWSRWKQSTEDGPTAFGTGHVRSGGKFQHANVELWAPRSGWRHKRYYKAVFIGIGKHGARTHQFNTDVPHSNWIRF